MSAEYFFIAFLLTTNSEPQLGGYAYDKLKEAGNKLVVDWDLANANFFQVEWQFDDDIALLRTRLYELEECPHSSYVNLLPSEEQIKLGMEANEAYQKELQRRMILELDRLELLWIAYLEAKELHNLWDHALTARRSYSTICTRNALKVLQADRPDWCMPPALPYWRLECK